MGSSALTLMHRSRRSRYQKKKRRLRKTIKKMATMQTRQMERMRRKKICRVSQGPRTLMRLIFESARWSRVIIELGITLGCKGGHFDSTQGPSKCMSALCTVLFSGSERKLSTYTHQGIY